MREILPFTCIFAVYLLKYRSIRNDINISTQPTNNYYIIIY